MDLMQAIRELIALLQQRHARLMFEVDELEKAIRETQDGEEERVNALLLTAQPRCPKDGAM